MTLDANRARAWSTLATRVNTAWTFTSGPPATDDDGARARLTNPAAGHGTGFVSLRVKAGNAAGNTIEQTIIHAYGLT